MASLRINEIFYSLQGETTLVGLPTVFVRLTGCPLRCQYCDSEYAFHKGERLSLDTIMDQVMAYAPRYVTVSGGEPLAQPECLPLLTMLCDAGLNVSLETSGAMDISRVDARVTRILDIKTPGSLEMNKNRWANFEYLTTNDQVKFVICHREDYEFAKATIAQYALDQCCPVLFSPSYQQIDYRTLADWIIEDNLPVRFQLQMHKHIWGDVPGR
jgi:7-carboxy-7-deazaguanine synthase